MLARIHGHLLDSIRRDKLEQLSSKFIAAEKRRCVGAWGANESHAQFLERLRGGCYLVWMQGADIPRACSRPCPDDTTPNVLRQ